MVYGSERKPSKTREKYRSRLLLFQGKRKKKIKIKMEKRGKRRWQLKVQAPRNIKCENRIWRRKKDTRRYFWMAQQNIWVTCLGVMIKRRCDVATPWHDDTCKSGDNCATLYCPEHRLQKLKEIYISFPTADPLSLVSLCLILSFGHIYIYIYIISSHPGSFPT